jgi:tetratricopeptide (TPR) repeat protein
VGSCSYDKKGKLLWLQSTSYYNQGKYKPQEKPMPPPPKSPSKLPQRLETWYVAVKKLQVWITPEDESPYQPYGALILNMDQQFIQGFNVYPASPAPQELLEALFEAMTSRPTGSTQRPHRPKKVQFQSGDLAESIISALEEIGIQVAFEPMPEIAAEIFADMEEHLGGRPPLPGLLSGRGVTPELVGDFFDAAAQFYRAAPWVHLTNRQPLAIRVGKEKRQRVVVVMGNAGVEYGLSVYEKWRDLEALFGLFDDVMEVIPSGGAQALSFEEIPEVPFEDLDAVDRYGWEVASQDSYPVPLIFTPDREVKRPNRKMLLWYEAALRAITAFVPEHLKPADDGDYQPVEAVINVTTHEGQKKVEIEYPAGEIPAETQPAGDPLWEQLEGEEGDVILPPGFDRRSMEGAMLSFGGGFENPDEAEAQKLMYQAWEEQNPAKRITLAHKALSVSPNCADAYVLLAEEQADTLGRAADFYRKGVEAGERALGKDFFEQNEGYFWGMLETRPYMRAREGLAFTLLAMGKREEALHHYQDMLRLNPGDNQGIRYSLLNLLMSLERYDEVDSLLDEYEDDWSSEWCYTQALRTYQKEGDSENARTALKKAIEQNQFVPKFLLGEKRIPKRLPDLISLGRDSEAISYASTYLNYWRKTPGAVAWLKAQTSWK